MKRAWNVAPAIRIHLLLCSLLLWGPAAQASQDDLLRQARELWGLVEQRQFVEIDRRLTDMVTTRQRTDTGFSLAGEIFRLWIFDSPTEERVQLQRLPQLDAWCEQSPDSSMAFAARGVFYISYAWEARGTGRESTVTDEGWDLFKEHLKLAERDLTRAQKLDSQNPIPPWKLLWVDIGLSGNVYDMEAHCQQAIAIDPELYEAYYAKLTYLMPKWHGDEERMLVFAREVVANAPAESGMWTVLAYAHKELAKELDDPAAYLSQPDVWQEVEQAYTHAIAAYPKSASRPMNFAKLAALAGRHDVAQTYFDRAIQLDPTDVEAHYERARFLRYTLHDSEAALEGFAEAIRRHPLYGKALHERGLLYSNSKQWQLAEQDLRQEIALTPHRYQPYYRLGEVYRQQRRFEQAIEQYTNAIERRPSEAKCYKQRGQMYVELGRFEEAVQDFGQAIELKPSEKDYWFSRGYAHLMLGRYQEAVEDNTKAIEFDPTYIAAYKNRARAYRELGRMAERNADRQMWMTLEQQATGTTTRQ